MASKKWKKAPHFVTLCLTLTQSMACVGVILWYTLGRDEMWKKHVQFMMFAVGVFGSRIWTALLSVTLLLLRMKSLSFVLNNCRPFLLVAGWGSVFNNIFFSFLFYYKEQLCDFKNNQNLFIIEYLLCFLLVSAHLLLTITLKETIRISSTANFKLW